MCRIAGIIGPRSRDDSGLLQELLRPMKRRPSDIVATCADASPLVSCGAVLSRSSHFGEPAWNEENNIASLVSGNPFTSVADRQWLRSRGHRMGKEDSAGLVHLYEELGISAFGKLNNWFSGVLVDTRLGQAILFNDRYGLNRIYLHQRNGRLFFASEAKSLLAVLPDLRELDEQGLAEWFSCGCALGNRTLFRGISLLPPGSAWIFSADGTLKKESYFSSSEWENQPALSSTEFSERLLETFPRVLNRYTNGSEPVAMSLTGGLDGRMIMAWARPNRGRIAMLYIQRVLSRLCGRAHRSKGRRGLRPAASDDFSRRRISGRIPAASRTDCPHNRWRDGCVRCG